MRKILFFMLFALVGVFVALALTSGGKAEASTLASPAASPRGDETLPSTESEQSPSHTSLVDVAPATDVSVCGNSAAVASVGTGSGCSGDQQSATDGGGAAGSASLVDVAPATDVSVCGNSAAVASVGTGSGCSGDRQPVVPPGETVAGSDVGGSSPRGDVGSPAPEGTSPSDVSTEPSPSGLFVAGGGSLRGSGGTSTAAVLAASVLAPAAGLAPTPSPSASLAFTGVPVLCLAGVALALIFAGLLLVSRQRRANIATD
jgi:hypothetical protein